MSKELEALKRIRQETCPATYMDDFDKNECCDVIEQALLRLEAIDNANPSEALKIFNKVDNIRLLFTKEEKLTIKQALLKSQEQEQYYFDLIQLLKENNMDYYTLKEMFKQQEPNHYLKWEDLDFKENNQRIKVKLGSNIYTLDFYIGQFGKTFVLNLQHYCEAKDNKQFFNDLHLERVEE